VSIIAERAKDTAEYVKLSAKNTRLRTTERVNDEVARDVGQRKGIRGVTTVKVRKIGECKLDENSSVEEIEAKVKEMIAAARTMGFWVAASNLEHYIKGYGGVKSISRSWLRSFRKVREAESLNLAKFEKDNILELVRRVWKDGDQKMVTEDHWDKVITYNNAGFSIEELYYASGDSSLTSKGSFMITIKGKFVTVKGLVYHRWHDKYDWHVGFQAIVPGFGCIPDAALKKLQTHGNAREYRLECKWKHGLETKFCVGDKDIKWNWRIVL